MFFASIFHFVIGKTDLSDFSNEFSLEDLINHVFQRNDILNSSDKYKTFFNENLPNNKNIRQSLEDLCC